VNLLKSKQKIIEEVQFSPQSTLNYKLQIQTGLDNIKADLSGNTIQVSLPQSTAVDWLNSDQVGLKATQEIGKNQFLKIVIEKDFACLTPRKEEDQSDLLPHPKKSS